MDIGDVLIKVGLSRIFLEFGKFLNDNLREYPQKN